MAIPEILAQARTALAWACLVSAAAGSVYAILCLAAVLWFRARANRPPANPAPDWPPVTILKPVCGLEKGLAENLRSACRQDYPEYQVVLSVLDPDDPALPLLEEIAREFGAGRVSVAAGGPRLGANGKINNLAGGLACARHDVLVISDSDVRLRPDYLKTVVAPLADPAVGYVCTLYKTAGAGNLYEKLELLTLNAELIPSMVFARVTGAARFLIGASVALRRSVLEASGGLAPLADCLVEDNEMGRRIRATGRRGELLPYVIDTVPDLGGFARWWHHQGHWDQCNRAANPWGYLAAGVVRGVPFALLFALARGFDPFGLSVLGGALAVRLAAAAGTLAIGLGDREGLRSLWLLPLRDLAGFVSWILAYVRRTTVWRGRRFTLTRGRLRP